MTEATTEVSQEPLPPRTPGDLPLPLRSLIEAGVHFGHQTKRWNPKMRPFIYGARNGMYFVTNRWLGGTLTNFRTIKQGLDRLRSLERMKDDGTYEQLPKKEVS